MRRTILDVHFIPDVFARTNDTRLLAIDRSTNEPRDLYGKWILEALIDQSTLCEAIDSWGNNEVGFNVTCHFKCGQLYMVSLNKMTCPPCRRSRVRGRRSDGSVYRARCRCGQGWSHRR